MAQPTLLFAYGTLKTEARARGGRPAHIRGQLFCNGAFPALCLPRRSAAAEGEGWVAGFVFAVTQGDLARYDHIEGVASGFYQRRRIRTREGDETWIYEGAGCLKHESWEPVLPDEEGVICWPRL